jgi:cardiolipin synthase
MTVDGIVANVGSANVNGRSTERDEEINVVGIDPFLTATLDRHFDEDLARSERVRPGRWEERSVWQRVVETATRPFRGSF